jgi:YggT family protein
VGYFANAGVILVEVIFGLAAGLFALRVLLQWVRANFYNPVCQFFYKATNPVLVPMRKAIRPWRNFDLAGALVVWLLVWIKVWLLFALMGRAPGFSGSLVLGLAELIGFVLMLYFWLILVRAILSFVGQDSRHPMVPLIVQLTEPVLRPVRRMLPAMGGIDLSPLLVTVVIFLLRALVEAPLRDLGMSLVG